MAVKFGPVGYPVYKRTYARKLSNGQKEEYEDTIDRCLLGCNNQLHVGFTPSEIEDFRTRLHEMHGFFAGRFMWQLGTGTVDRLGLMSLQNCAGVVADGPIRPYTWTFSNLMLGAGVGGNIQREYVYEWPKVRSGVKITRKDTKDADFIVPDSREGWVQLLKMALTAFFVTGSGFTYSTICLRPKGAEIRTFGGIASGPDILCEGIEKISSVLRARAGKKCRSIDALDLFDIIGSVVVAGNVRRSALILGGDPDDALFMDAKRWDRQCVPAHRSMSNNSFILNRFSQLSPLYAEQFSQGGEVYGLLNLRLARECGRSGETQYPDKNIVIFNPCGEQGLWNYETCCLAELCLPRIESYEDIRIMAEYLYRTCKHSLLLPCHEPETEAVVHSNMRMGIGITGYMQSPEHKKQWLPKLYEHLREYDIAYSRDHNIPTSIKLTTVKPSGTLSKLAGVTEGCNPAESEYIVQRVRFSADSDMIPPLRRAGYPIEYQMMQDGSIDRTTLVVEFPSSFEGSKTVKDTSVVHQLETVMRLQKEWSDNGVSVTCTYDNKEVDEIFSWLKVNYDDNIKTVSFLRKDDRSFPQMPREAITKEKYLEMTSKIVGLDLNLSTDNSVDSALECSSGMCPLR